MKRALFETGLLNELGEDFRRHFRGRGLGLEGVRLLDAHDHQRLALVVGPARHRLARVQRPREPIGALVEDLGQGGDEIRHKFRRQLIRRQVG